MVLLGALRRGLGVRGVGRVVLLIGVVVGLGGLVRPVVDEDEVLVGQPHRARVQVVEHDGVAVDPEDRGGGGGELVVVGGVGAAAEQSRAAAHELARAGPGRVDALAQAHRLGGHALRGGALLGRRRSGDLAPVHGDGDELVAGGDQDRVRLGAGLLEHQAGGPQADGLALGQVEDAGAALQDHGLVTDGGDRQIGAGRQLQGGVRGLLPALVAGLQGDQRLAGG